MRTITNKFSFTHLPPVLKRGRQVMLAIFDRDARLYLSRKHVYPMEIYRLFGGGVEDGEKINLAASRELREETGLSLPLSHKQRFEFQLKETTTDQQYKHKVDLFYTVLQFQPIEPGDDVNGMKIFLKSDIKDLITLYSELSQDLVTGKDGSTFRWHDWGVVFGKMLEYTQSNWPQT